MSSDLDVVIDITGEVKTLTIDRITKKNQPVHFGHVADGFKAISPTLLLGHARVCLLLVVVREKQLLSL